MSDFQRAKFKKTLEFRRAAEWAGKQVGQGDGSHGRNCWQTRRGDRGNRPCRGVVVDHLVLMKPRVMSLVVFTGAVGFVRPGHVDWLKLVATLSAMAAGAGACGALNMWWDADIDANMARTAMRPIPRGAVPSTQALAIGALLSIVSVGALGMQVGWLAAALLALTIAIYIPLYTMVLKRRTPRTS